MFAFEFYIQTTIPWPPLLSRRKGVFFSRASTPTGIIPPLCTERISAVCGKRDASPISTCPPLIGQMCPKRTTPSPHTKLATAALQHTCHFLTVLQINPKLTILHYIVFTCRRLKNPELKFFNEVQMPHLRCGKSQRSKRLPNS